MKKFKASEKEIKEALDELNDEISNEFMTTA